MSEKRIIFCLYIGLPSVQTLKQLLRSDIILDLYLCLVKTTRLMTVSKICIVYTFNGLAGKLTDNAVQDQPQ